MQFYAVSPSEFNSLPSPCDCLAHRFGNAADQPDRAPAYGSDMTDTEWAVVRELLPVPAWLEGCGREQCRGNPRSRVWTPHQAD